MNTRFNNKIVLITGSTQSIGAALVKAFAKEGATVIASGRKSASEQANAIPPGATTYVRLDVSVEKDWQDVTAFIQKTYGKLDILINNAGIAARVAENPEQVSLDVWREVFSINVEGVVLGCKYAISLMKQSEDPCIINMGSRSALIGSASYGAYAASKAVIASYTKTVADHGIELFSNKKSQNPIRCVDIQPANIRTKMWDFDGDKTKERNYLHNLPFKRMGEADEVAKLAVAVADTRYITGVSYLLDGGAMIKGGSYQTPVELPEESRDSHKQPKSRL